MMARMAQVLAAIALVGITALAGVAALTGPASAADRLDPQAVLKKSEAAIGRSVGNYTLTDAKGAPLPLRSFRGKPVIVSLVYTSCSSVCPTITQSLLKAVTNARAVFGPDRFAVLTVGFDARNDTPTRLTQFASTQGIDLSSWAVASADSATLEALLRDVGFSYTVIAGGFDHVTQTTLLDSDGRVYRHVYGDDFPLQMLMEPLKDLVYGTTTAFSLSSVIDRIKFICTTFDPGAGRYRIDYGLVFGSVIAAISLMIFGGLLWREWRRTRPAPPPTQSVTTG